MYWVPTGGRLIIIDAYFGERRGNAEIGVNSA